MGVHTLAAASKYITFGSRNSIDGQCAFIGTFVMANHYNGINIVLDFLVNYGYIGVFIAAFLAATVLPFCSEVVFAGVLASGATYSTLIIAATIGNSLGGMTCYWLGSLGKLEWLEKYFRMKEEQIQKWVNKIHGRGSWVSIFVALPGVGDFIAVAMGYLRANAWGVLFWMTLGKFIRYVVVGEAAKAALSAL